jgi:hypothetical protein
LAHEYCYFLHDACIQLLREYEKEEAHLVSLKFKDEDEAAQFYTIVNAASTIEALHSIGRTDEARRATLNSIVLVMVSDCFHHIFEALHCMERRKFIVALNLFRKPLLDSLIFLSWMLGDEDDFYEAFTTQSPEALTSKIIGNRRSTIFASALSRTEIASTVNAGSLHSMLFDDANERGLYRLLQRAVHLVTAQRIKLRTEPQNFNFIYKRHTDDDVYIAVYDTLPAVMLYLSHVVLGLFDRMQPMDAGSKAAFTVRSIYGLHLVEGDQAIAIQQRLSILSDYVRCSTCNTAPKLTYHNAARILMTESFRCTACKKVTAFPFAWLAECWHGSTHPEMPRSPDGEAARFVV